MHVFFGDEYLCFPYKVAVKKVFKKCTAPLTASMPPALRCAWSLRGDLQAGQTTALVLSPVQNLTGSSIPTLIS